MTNFTAPETMKDSDQWIAIDNRHVNLKIQPPMRRRRDNLPAKRDYRRSGKAGTHERSGRNGKQSHQYQLTNRSTREAVEKSSVGPFHKRVNRLGNSAKALFRGAIPDNGFLVHPGRLPIDLSTRPLWYTVLGRYLNVNQFRQRRNSQQHSQLVSGI